ncbi:thiolase family protein [Nocardia mangyaensis]|uniref:thiolase family protein n=1 Tax=Nocardia mangyaensis TaxID=2213200 RepID=UPI0026745B57|nr:thiolase family protein [Nocardia mangyaensis]MDO3647913.1 thiolase family protein [Nocardia mangyaensis]
MSAVIVDVVRTPSGRGKAGGGLSSVHPATLLAGVLTELVARTGIDPALVDDVIGGCVTQSGEQANNISRTAVLAAGFPESVPATTVDRQCGSSQQAVHFAAQGVLAGAYDIAIACGVESMSRAPMFSNTQGKDSLRGPLAARYPDGLIGQGIAAEILAARWKLDRATLDEFAARSHRLAAATAAAGGFDAELVAAGELTADETIRTGTTVETLAGLRPAFTDPAMRERFSEIDWSVTAGNSSPLTDGASAALIMSEATAAKLGLTPRARFHSFAVLGDDPTLMLTAVIPATRKALERVALTVDDIDTFEVNEAFAPVPLVWQQELGVDPDRVNPRGGAIALGHPLGASGTRLLATMVNHLEQTGGRYGLQTMCEAGGLANATIIERL